MLFQALLVVICDLSNRKLGQPLPTTAPQLSGPPPTLGVTPQNVPTPATAADQTQSRSPGGVAQLVGALPCAPEGRGLNSLSGHMPRGPCRGGS